MASSNRREIKRQAQEVVRRLERNPELLERIESIVTLSEADELKTLDEIESVLIEEVRKLAGETQGSWTSRREEQLASELLRENGKVRLREKTLHFHTTVGEVEVKERLWRMPGRSHVRLLPEAIGVRCRGLSGKLPAVLYDFGIADSFRLAAHRLNVHYGFGPCPERIRLATL